MSGKTSRDWRHCFRVGSCFLILLMVTSACASRITSDVTRFHSLDGQVQGSAQIVALNPDNQNSLEFESYAALIGAELAVLGFAPALVGADGQQKADFIVEIDYGVSDKPSYKISNMGASYRFGFGVGHYPYGPRMRHHGFYSHYGLGYGYPGGYAYVRPVYTRHLELAISRVSDNQRIFEGQVESRGRSRQLVDVMPYLVLAMFEGYPGVSGETHRVSIVVESGTNSGY